MNIFKFALFSIVLFSSATVLRAADWRREAGLCGSDMDNRAAVTDCSDLIYHWMFKEQLPTDPQLASAYHAKGAWAYYLRAQSYALLGENSRAIHDYTESIRLSNMVRELFYHSRAALIGRAYAYFSAGLYDLAIADYSTLLETEENVALKSVCLLMRGEAYLQKGAYNQALSDFNAGLAASPTFYAVYLARARLYIATDQLDLAVADCTAVLNLYPNLASAYMRRGIAYWYKGLDRLAEEDLSKGISLDDSEIMSFYSRAAVRKRQGRVTDALADWRKVLELSAGTEFERKMQQEAAVEIGEVMH